MTYGTLVLVSFILTLMADIIIRINSFIGISNGSTEVAGVLHLLAILALVKAGKRFRCGGAVPPKAWFVFKLFVAWNFVSFVRGALSANEYWDWKMLLLNYLFSILVPLAVVVGLHYQLSLKIFRFLIKVVLPVAILLIPLFLKIDYQLYPRVVLPVSLLLLFLPYIKPRWRIVIILTAIVSIAIDPNYRSNTLRILFPMVLLGMYSVRRILNVQHLNVVCFFLLCMPLFLLIMGVSGEFNIFTDNPFEYSLSNRKNTSNEFNPEKVSLSDDTRTFLYREVFHSMLRRDSSFLVGEGGGSAYESAAFADTILTKRGRYGSEVGFLNLLLYSGGVGVFLYSMMLFLPAYYAINRSNNYLCKMLGVFLSFHWMLLFIEDIVQLDLNFYIVWLVIGLCLSRGFRNLNDVDVKLFFIQRV